MSLTGKNLLDNSLLNKDTAFTEAERDALNLRGKLPCRVETLEQQALRCYQQYQAQSTDLAKNVYLYDLLNRNETLFYRLASDHLKEMMPIVYTPVVGESIQKWSQEFRRSRGVIISYPDKDKIEKILDEYLTADLDMIVVTDAEGILGIGDQGVGGINICIGKLAVYTLCAGVNPHRVLPIQLDVGTNNEDLRKDPTYLGWNHERVTGKDYDDFIDCFVKAVLKKLPNIFLHWEDFGRDTARHNLERYQKEICTFNDDMQGTAVITLGAVLSALNVTGQNIKDQQVVMFGSGTSGAGIADMIVAAKMRQGLSLEEARSHLWLLGRRGLLIEQNKSTMAPFQYPYIRSEKDFGAWNIPNKNKITLLDVIKNAKPSILIGASTVAGAFTEEIVKEMARHIERPIIFPLSNPTKKAEAIPHDLLTWTNRKALVATGSPFPDENINGKPTRIAQCNNAFVFPGIGLGVIAVKARRVTDSMLWAAGEALMQSAPTNQDKSAPLLCSLDEVKQVNYQVAIAVGKQAIEDHVADKVVDVEQAVKSTMWEPNYGAWPHTK